MILTDDTQQVIARSTVRPFDEDHPNQRLDSLQDEGSTGPSIEETSEQQDIGDPDNESVHSPATDSEDGLLVSTNDILSQRAPIVNPTDLIGLSIVANKNDGGTEKATVTRKLNDRDDKWVIRFLNGGEDILSYHEIINLINRTDDSGEKLWTFKEIQGHKRHGSRKDKWKVKVLWDNGETSWEPLDTMKETDPITLAHYAERKKITKLGGWRWTLRYLSNGSTIRTLRKLLKINKKKMKKGTVYQFGVAVPRNTRQAYLFDEQNGNTAWSDAIDEELSKISTYGTFEMLGENEGPPIGYTRIPMHMCFAVKWDGRRKARLVAGGNWTEPDGTDIYSGVVSNEAVRMGLFLAQHNDLDVMVGDIGNAYLHSYTQEKIYTVAGPEFGRHQGRILKIIKALYGLRTSAARWHEKLASDLRKLGWKPTRYDSDFWYRDAGNHYEYLLSFHSPLYQRTRPRS